MKLLTLLLAILTLTGCAYRPPDNVDNACLIFEQRSSLFNNWQKQAKRVETEFGVPVPVMMATIYQESRFVPRARPPRRKLLGFIPWRRPSTAYGYAQALTSTWGWYEEESGRSGSRTRFKDAIHFVGWYHDQSHRRNGIAKTDAYNLYLAYYAGHGGYARGTYRHNRSMLGAANRVARMAAIYDQQLRACGRR
ncbi:hypothetical protein [Isoalcanivorax beigongshangi]|uniref:Transglycosylase SLT domain-containing protein n=1 Tax=Isoalcanivorax beigongshangi TaxID=3238810 RepID=A0ABV4AHR2_9GAMM